MTDKERNWRYSNDSENTENDPLLELTRLFAKNSATNFASKTNNMRDDEGDGAPLYSQTNAADTTDSAFDDDLSFLESEIENELEESLNPSSLAPSAINNAPFHDAANNLSQSQDYWQDDSYQARQEPANDPANLGFDELFDAPTLPTSNNHRYQDEMAEQSQFASHQTQQNTPQNPANFAVNNDSFEEDLQQFIETRPFSDHYSKDQGYSPSDYEAPFSQQSAPASPRSYEERHERAFNQPHQYANTAPAVADIAGDNHQDAGSQDWLSQDDVDLLSEDDFAFDTHDDRRQDYYTNQAEPPLQESPSFATKLAPSTGYSDNFDEDFAADQSYDGFGQSARQEPQFAPAPQSGYQDEERYFAAEHAANQSADHFNNHYSRTQAPRATNDMPDIDTYQFIDHQIENTEPLDLPPLPAQEMPRKAVDSLEEEFEDIFSHDQIEQVPYNFRDNAPFAEDEPEDPFALDGRSDEPIDDRPFFEGEERQYGDENWLEDDYNNTNAIAAAGLMAGGGFTLKRANNKRKYLYAGLLIAAVAIVGGYFWMKEPTTQAPAIIHADNGPIKSQPAITNNSQDSQDIIAYDQVAGSVGEHQQGQLLDQSEVPDLNAYNSQPPQSSEDTLSPDSIQNAIASASNKVIPTNTVPTVSINGEGEISINDDDASAITNSSSDDIANIVASNADIPYQSSQANPAEATTASIPVPVPAPQAAPTTQTTTPAVVASPPATAGRYYVQLASNPTYELAQVSRERAQRDYSAIIGNRPLEIQSANIADKGVYYRVRVALSSRESAVSLCESLKTAGASCFVTR